MSRRQNSTQAPPSVASDCSISPAGAAISSRQRAAISSKLSRASSSLVYLKLTSCLTSKRTSIGARPQARSRMIFQTARRNQGSGVINFLSAGFSGLSVPKASRQASWKTRAVHGRASALTCASLFLILVFAPLGRPAPGLRPPLGPLTTDRFTSARMLLGLLNFKRSIKEYGNNLSVDRGMSMF
jgi:hypothetical protein